MLGIDPEQWIKQPPVYGLVLKHSSTDHPKPLLSHVPHFPKRWWQSRDAFHARYSHADMKI
jgi:hypothetical protein